MRTIISTFTALLFSLAGFAKSTSSVKGIVTDQTSKPLTAATISLLVAKDSSLYKAAVSDNNGAYFFEEVKAGNYLIKITNVNYKTWYSKTFELQDAGSYAVPAATLAIADKKLKEVVVTSTKKPMVE